MSENAKRLSLMLTLNPALSEADRFAIRALKRWYQQAKRSHEVEEDLQATVKKFHRDIYLSGLFLHLLNPGLASNLANLLTEEDVSLQTLLYQLNSMGFAVSETAPADDTREQLEQIQAAIAEQQQGDAFSTLMSQLQALTSLVEAQQNQLQRLTTRTSTVAASSATEKRLSEQKEAHELPEAEVRDQMKKIKQKGIF